LVCDVHDKGTKLDIAIEVIFYEACCEGCVLHAIKKNFRIDRVKVNVDVIVLHIKAIIFYSVYENIFLYVIFLFNL
jgi:hypothetical protein